jgi:UDP-glucose 4-epimerase
MFSTNVGGTFNVLRAAARHGVERVIFTSSPEVYGEPVSWPVDEAHPLLAMNSYGASKAAGEAYCRAFRREAGLQAVVLRLGSVYGPRDYGRPIPTWLAQAMAGEELHVYGGNTVGDFIWVGQAVEALVRAAHVDVPLPPINVASGTGTRVIDVARRIARLGHHRCQVRMLPPGVSHGAEFTHFIASVGRMGEFLNIDPPLDPLAHLASLAVLPAVPLGAAS